MEILASVFVYSLHILDLNDVHTRSWKSSPDNVFLIVVKVEALYVLLSYGNTLKLNIGWPLLVFSSCLILIPVSSLKKLHISLF